MSNIIQIKRSTTTSGPASLANGELAFSFLNTANSLFIGNPADAVPGTPLRIGGGKYNFLHQANTTLGSGGILTANAVVITNANNFTDQFKTNTLVIGPDGTTNAAATLVVSGTANITSNTTISGALTVLGNVNVSGVTNYGTSNVSFDTDTLFIDAINNRVGILTVTPDAALQVVGAANVAGNAAVLGTLSVTKSTTLANTISVTGNATFSNTISINGDATLYSKLTVAANLDVSSGSLFVDAVNDRVGINISAPTVALDVVGDGKFTANLSANNLSITNGAVIGGNVAFDTDTLFIDTVNNRVGILTTAPDAGLSVNSTANVTGNTAIGGKLIVTGNSTFSNTVVVTGNASFSNTITVAGATTLNSTLAVSGNAAFSTSVLFVDSVNSRIGIKTTNPTVALDVVGDIYASANVHANNMTLAADLTVNGNVNINGVLTTIDTVNLVIEDPMFKLAKNNNVASSAGDAIDAGFYSVYANTTADMYTGMFRDSSDGKYKLFTNLNTEPTTVVDTADPTFRFATLQAYLEMGGLTANSTNFMLTANSTYAVSVVANSISLGTALAVGSGGTGTSTFATNGVLYGNGTSALQATAAGANGHVLQVVSNVPTFAGIDGGTF